MSRPKKKKEEEEDEKEEEGEKDEEEKEEEIHTNAQHRNLRGENKRHFGKRCRVSVSVLVLLHIRQL